MARFDAIHVSDFHFGRREARPNIKTLLTTPVSTLRARETVHALRVMHRQATHNPALAIQVARFLTERFEAGTLLLLSGDIAATGRTEDLQVGVAFLGNPPSVVSPHLGDDLRPTLAAGDFRICLVPGNHDRYVDHMGRPGSVEFDRLFRDHWGDPNPFVRSTVLRDPETGERLAVIAADMCFAARDYRLASSAHYGHGRAAPSIVAMLEAKTTDVRETFDGVGVCWMLHFPPSLTDGDVPGHLRLEDDHLVVAAAARSNVRLIVAGHTHVSSSRTQGLLTVVCAGSATFYMQSGGHYVHHLEIDVHDGVATLAARTNFRWDEANGGFTPV